MKNPPKSERFPDADYDYKYLNAGGTEPFSIGQCYDNAPAEQQACQKCGSVIFHVGIGSHFTAVRCVNCKWELCVHDG